MLPKHLRSETCEPIRTGAQIKDPTASTAIGNISKAEQERRENMNDRTSPVLYATNFDFDKAMKETLDEFDGVNEILRDCE